MTVDDADIKYLKGLGERRAKALEKELGGSSFRDLLMYIPSRYVDRSRFYRIADLSADLPYVQIKGRFISFKEEGEGAKRRLKGVFSDGAGLMETVWFSKISTIRNMLRIGEECVIFGKPSLFDRHFSIAHPEIEKFDPDRPMQGLRGIYSLSDPLRKAGVTQRVLSTALRSLMDRSEFLNLFESIPRELMLKYNLMTLREALFNLHFPRDAESLSRAKFRMKFEELFYLELNIIRFARKRAASTPGHVLSKVGDYFNGFYFKFLPFELTSAQKRVLREIRADVATGRQMNRLLQGDVGSGKTMVAFMSMLLAVDNGLQACIMAPTEILASQHYATLRSWCDGLGLNCALLTGSTRSAERRYIHEGLTDGSLHILVGTHALIEEKVEFRHLGLAVIDEQHRFGVAQRARLWAKGEIPPHVLVMTATPIPRTLAMTVYGDLDVSVIDELPPGRKPVTTVLAMDNHRMEINRLIGNQLRLGRQVYIVYPLVHESPKLAAKSVEEGFERISGLFPDYQVSMVHGKQSVDKKDKEMRRFVEGESRILVATTVIEVGVNVPNATVMVIENAERFGLSQLHQLRGRVGRGADKSYCVLVGNPKMSADTRRRLEIMTSTTDGFLVSEADLKFRGPGDMEGTQQSGMAFNLKVASLAADGQILTLARDEAERVFDHNSEFHPDSLRLLASELFRRFSHKIDWSQIS